MGMYPKYDRAMKNWLKQQRDFQKRVMKEAEKRMKEAEREREKAMKKALATPKLPKF